MGKKNNNELGDHFTNSSRQTIIIFLSKIIGYFLGFITNFILARFYGANIIGQYTLINTYLQLITIITLFGFDNGLIKYISRYNKDGNSKLIYETIKISFIFSILFSLSASFITFFARDYIASIFNNNLLAQSLIIGSWIIIPMTLNRLLGGIYKGFKKIKFYIIGNEVYRRTLMLTFLLVFLIFKQTSIIKVISALFISNLLITFFYIVKLNFYKLNYKSIIFDCLNLNFSSKIRDELFSYSAMMILISFMNVILARTDRVMLGIFSSTNIVGIYNVAAIISGLVIFLLTSSNMTFAPIISELYMLKKINLLNDLYTTITKWIVIFTTPIFITIIVFPETLLNIFGLEYVEGVSILLLLSLGQFINVLVGANGYLLTMSGHEKAVLFNNFFISVLNIILNYIFIPKFGMVGAAMATAISISTGNILKVIQVKFFLNILPYSKKSIILIINLISNYILAYIINSYFDNIISVIIVTILNISISISFIYFNSDKIDFLIFEKIINKFYKK